MLDLIIEENYSFTWLCSFSLILLLNKLFMENFPSEKGSPEIAEGCTKLVVTYRAKTWEKLASANSPEELEKLLLDTIGGMEGVTKCVVETADNGDVSFEISFEDHDDLVEACQGGEHDLESETFRHGGTITYLDN